MVNGIKYACQTFRGRASGSKAEQDCQEYFAKELKKFADEVTTEEFTLHPKAFLGWISISAVLSMSSVILYWLSQFTSTLVIPILGVAAVVISGLLYLFENLLYRKCIDFLMPETRSCNVYAVRHAAKETKRRIILGGHADAAYEMTYLLNGKSAYAILIGANIGILFMLVTSTALLFAVVNNTFAVKAPVWTVIGITDILFIPFYVALLKFVNWNQIVDGANDNLSACFVALAALRELSQQDKRFDYTEVCCLITGSEEAGLRGALDFARKHKAEFEKTETVFIALDTLRETQQLKVYTNGQNGLQKNCKKVGRLLQEAAAYCGLDIAQAKPYPGATDAEAFSRYGLKSCGLCGVDHNIQTYYHTRHDTWTNISEDCLSASLSICMKAVDLYDQKGLVQKV